MYKRGGSSVGEGAKIENSQGYRDWLKANGKNDNASMRRAYANEAVRKLTDLFGKAFRLMGFGGKDGGKRQGLKFSFVDKIEDAGSGGANEADMERVSDKFDSDLQRQIDGTLDEGYVYGVGHPGDILRSTGIPDVPIQPNAARLKFKSEVAHHKFDISEIKGLVKSVWWSI